MSERPPVKDWATDFDHLDPRWINDPFPIWEDMRERCPIAHTDRFMGVYFPSRYADVRAIAYDTEHVPGPGKTNTNPDFWCFGQQLKNLQQRVKEYQVREA